jgi:hypothetical protein
VGCTVDECNEVNDVVVNTANNANCDNGDFCDGTETCDATNDCEAGPALACGDGVSCTVDVCNEDTDQCDNTPDDTVCNDGDVCTDDTCDPLDDCHNVCDSSNDDAECFLEIANLIWDDSDDSNENGDQTDDGIGIGNVAIDILSCENGVATQSVGMVETGVDGSYSFRLPTCTAETLAVKVKDINFDSGNSLEGYSGTLPDQTTEALDSDCSVLEHQTVCRNIARGTIDNDADCGFFMQPPPPPPTTTCNKASLDKAGEGCGEPLPDEEPPIDEAVGIPTIPEWGMILLTLALLTTATWQLAGRPVMFEAGARGTVAIRPTRRRWLTSLLLGQCIATLGLGLYALLQGPLVPHDGVGAFLSGLLIGVMVECYRRSR